MLGLTIDPPPAHGVRPGPDRPTIILPCPGEPLRFASLAGLARKVHTLRAGGAIRLSRGVASYDGSVTFPMVKLWVTGFDEAERYCATLAVQGVSIERLAAAIAAANPDMPAGLAA